MTDFFTDVEIKLAMRELLERHPAYHIIPGVWNLPIVPGEEDVREITKEFFSILNSKRSKNMV